LNTFFAIQEVTHGGKNKNDRITWALQGRFEHGRIFFKKDAEWIADITEQLLDFPNPMAHDDLIDALAYIDQIATTLYEAETVTDTWQPLDSISGF
jgi:predicted phage terminase large subunit-like protein